jgi:hypothetical protein
MRLTFALDEFGRVTCELSDGPVLGTASASNTAVAASELLRAVEDAEKTGTGECWWLESAGEYRWVIRREGERATLVVLWSGGTLTGWEHVFWEQDTLDKIASAIRSGLESIPVPAA